MKTIPVMVLLLCAVCYIIDINAQGYRSNSIDLIFGVEGGERLLRSTNDSPDEKEQINRRNNAERGKANYRIGFNYNYLVKEKFFLKTGLRYLNTGYKAKTPANMNREDQIHFTESRLMHFEASGYRQIYQMLELPLALRYVYSENWCMSYIEVGGSANHYLQTKLKGKDIEGNTRHLILEQAIKAWTFSTNVAIGAEFFIGNIIPAFIQMTARYQLTPLTDNAVEERLVALGLETGVRYVF